MSQAKKTSMGRTFSTVALLTIASKVIGMIRDILVARAYGVTPLADAYNYALLFTGNILILFGGLGGPFHQTTLLVLNPKKDDPDSGTLISQILAITALILFLAAALLFILAPEILHRVFNDYGATAAPVDRLVFFREATIQLRWMSPLVVLSGLIGVTYGVLNVFERIFWPSLSPAIASVAIIVALFLFPSDPSLPLEQRTSLPLAIGALIGAFGQLFAQIPDMFRCGLTYKFSLTPSPELRKYLSILWPLFVVTSIGQLTIYIDSTFASYCEPGTWTAVSNANRLMQLPLGVLITAILVPIVARLQDHAKAGDPAVVLHEFFRALRFMLFVSFPLTMVLLVLPRPIIECLFQRGSWTQEATNLVALAMLYLVPSLVIYIGRDLISRVFIAYEDTKTPYYVGIAAIAVKTALNYCFLFYLHMGIAGLSLSTSLITVFNFTCLAVLLRRKIGPLGMWKLFLPFLIMLVASVVAGAATYFVYTFMGPLMAGSKGMLHTLALLAGISAASGVGMVIYSGITIACRLEEPTMLMQRLKILPKEIDQ